MIIMERKSALVVPSQSIRFDLTGAEKIAYVVQDNRVRHVTVTTGLDDGHDIEIVSGLNSSDRIVTGMLGRLNDGQEVRLAAD
jgi:multidrug efflux pump subunit AcrA (membrane-fusion protein)